MVSTTVTDLQINNDALGAEMGADQYRHFRGDPADREYAGKEKSSGCRTRKEGSRMSLLVDIEKKLGAFTLHAQFETSGGIMALLGASGSSKSVTLKCIAGIMTPDRGHSG